MKSKSAKEDISKTRFDVYETLCPQQMLVHKGGQIKNWSGECRDIIPTKLQCQTIQRALQSPNLQREIIRKKLNNFFLNFHQLICSSSSTSSPSLKLLAVIVLRYHEYKFSKSKSAKGDNSKKFK